MEEISYRTEAMEWWNSLDESRRWLYVLQFYDDREWQSLTGREIELIYKIKKDILNH